MTVNKYQKVLKTDLDVIRNKIDEYNKKAFVFSVHGNQNKDGQGEYIDGEQAVYNNFMPAGYNPISPKWDKGKDTKTRDTIPYNQRIYKNQGNNRIAGNLFPTVTTEKISNASMMNFRNAVKTLFDTIWGYANFSNFMSKTHYNKMLSDYTYRTVLAEQLNDIEQTLDDINSALNVHLDTLFDGTACSRSCQQQCQTACQAVCQGWCHTCHNQHCGSAS